MSFLFCDLRSVLTPPSFTLSNSFLKSKRDRTLSPLKRMSVVCSTTSPPVPEPIKIESNLRPKTIEFTKETLDDGKRRPLRPLGRLLATHWMAVVTTLLIGVYFRRDYILTNCPAFLQCITKNASGITVLIVMTAILFDALFSGPQIRNIEKRTYDVE